MLFWGRKAQLLFMLNRLRTDSGRNLSDFLGFPEALHLPQNKTHSLRRASAAEKPPGSFTISMDMLQSPGGFSGSLIHHRNSVGFVLWGCRRNLENLDLLDRVLLDLGKADRQYSIF